MSQSQTQQVETPKTPTARPVQSPEDAGIIASVLGQIAGAEGEINNIFADDPDSALRPMTRPVPVAADQCVFGSKNGSDISVDISLWAENPRRAPRVIRGFDTDKDRVLVLQHATAAPVEFQVKRTKDGIPVLCSGAARLLALPGLCGTAPINALLLDVE